jgi:aryl-alcohol dehydrogenase-like predicted oxidoreductase
MNYAMFTCKAQKGGVMKPIKGMATYEGTARFATRLGGRKDFYALSQDLVFSSLGLGTFRKEPYREENYLRTYEEAIIEALNQGCNHFDTAINYRYQESEKELGRALKKAIDSGQIKRDEVIIATKGGFLPLEFPFPKDPYGWIRENIIESNLATKEEVIIDQHCLSVPYLEWSLEKSLENLGLESVDIFYIHNPETQLGYVSKWEVYQRMKHAFIWCEAKIKEGKIGAYGVATWNGFSYEPDHLEHLNLASLKRIASEISEEKSGFKFVQFPYNLGKTTAYTALTQALDSGEHLSALGAAKALGLEVILSSALLQMNLFKRPFSDQSVAILGGQSDIQAALQFARCAQGATSALFGSQDPLHVRHNFALKNQPRVPKKHYNLLYRMSA